MQQEVLNSNMKRAMKNMSTFVHLAEIYSFIELVWLKLGFSNTCKHISLTEMALNLILKSQ